MGENASGMASNEPIAIIGMGCRFPGQCDNPSKLWDLLRTPIDLLKEIPPERFNVDAYYHPQNFHHGTSNVRHTYVLDEDLRHFDAQFFGIKNIEANSIDPQQRLLLETVYECLEAAGLSLRKLRGSDTAVYVGVMSADYTDMIVRDIDTFPTYFATGTARSILSNRLSHFFDWHGPSMTIDTACSSSLIAMHQAVQTLRSGDSSVAIVAGSNLIIGPEQYIAESKLQMLSPTGRSRMWDVDADGYARGEGVAAIVLKRLSQAIADGDDIECVIRETGSNQDGKTPGITMPSASAQASLIRSTYAKAGLDLSLIGDRPQFFEAHGTGTPAGDPIEAEAISSAFFGPSTDFVPSSADVLFVGSIKTVVGHTEGTAGLAAVIKASLAIRHGLIPPNLLLNNLNPKVAPFYENLQILSKSISWPETPVRRASVNSFGFGGSNAHAILESFDERQSTLPNRSNDSQCFTPFIFSAASETALIATLKKYRDYLTEKTKRKDIKFTLRDLSWTLSSRRSTLGFRAVIPAASDFEDLISKVDECIESLGDSPPTNNTSDSTVEQIRVLGVFTGQGAQWARMGAELLEKSPAATEIITKLDLSLQSLAPTDRPSWSLYDQICASTERSEVNTASISQPLCTAIQIMLVEFLKAAGISFAAVVGHSSGEIGAAYAAGYLSAQDAIRIAYFRGLHLRNSVSEHAGAMMAVGTSFEDATELCELPAFEGRVVVAASNSSASVTLSGDADAVQEMRIIFEKEKKFTRILKVDQAYHSHHMQPLLEPYVRSLKKCNIRPLAGHVSNCRWVSSVFAQEICDLPESESLGSNYWASNLGSPVLFTEALRKSFDQLKGENSPYDLVLEVGPHPALKGPATETISDVLAGQSLPYIGMLSRGKDDVEAFTRALGLIWESFGEGAVDFAKLDRFASEGHSLPPRLVKGLPTYRWDHNREFWHESRLSKAFRRQKNSPNELLGRPMLDGAADQLRWRNILRRREIEWLDGHQVQGQTVFPCAGYVSACVEAVAQLVGAENPAVQPSLPQHTPRLIELHDFVVGQAVVFDEDPESGIETIVTLTDILWHEDEHTDNKIITAKFSFYSSLNAEAQDMVKHASCTIRVVAGDDVVKLPPRQPVEDEFATLDIESDRFYGALDKLGFGYSGPFRALSNLKRKLGVASGSIQTSPSTMPLLVQPATLDAAIQSIMLAYCYPGDSMLRSIYLPTGIKRLVIDLQQCLKFAGSHTAVPFDSVAAINTASGLSGDVSIYAQDGVSKAIQLEGLQTRPLSNPTESSDLNIFTELIWDVAKPDCDEIVRATTVEQLNADLLYSLERVTYFYLRSLDAMFSAPERKRLNLEWHHERLFTYIDHCLSKVANGTNRFAKQEWIHDTEDVVRVIFDKYPENIDLRLMRAVGENLPAVIRGESSMLEHMIHDNMLNDFYVVAHGMPRYTKYLASMASQIGHRYPHMNVLEIGAGTGGATKSFLRELGDQFSTYTFTDISGGFFGKAEQVFSSYSGRLNFKVLDIEKDIIDQGFAEGSFDVILASLVLHATRNLEETMHNVRKLLKPGGYLLLLEITENEQMRFGLIFGGLPGWWLGQDDGRALSPCIDLSEWDKVLRRTGFAGIDSSIPHDDELPVPLSIIVAQAIDERVDFLKSPLSQQMELVTPIIPRLTLIGGGGTRSAQLARAVGAILDLERRCGEMTFIPSIDSIRPDRDIPVGGTILCLADIDEPTFKSINAERLRGFQEIFKQSGSVLWLTQGSRFGDPFSRMVVGFGRTLVLEMLHIRLQFIDMNLEIAGDDHSLPDASLIAESLLRFEMAGVWESEDNSGGSSSLLYSSEPELFFEQESGRFFLPRFKLNRDQNNRYNSGRRKITNEVDCKETVVELTQRNGLYSLLEAPPASSLNENRSSQSFIDIEILYSISHAVEVIRGCFLFPIVGVTTHNGQRVLALSAKQSSRIQVPISFILPGISVPEVRNASIQALQLFYRELLALTAMRDMRFEDQILLLQPTPAFARAIDRIASDTGVKVLCLTTTESPSDIYKESKLGWRYIHPMASELEIMRRIPDMSLLSIDNRWVLLDMGATSTKNIAQNLMKLLPPGSDTKCEASLISSTAHVPPHVDADIRALLVKVKYAIKLDDSDPLVEHEIRGVMGLEAWTRNPGSIPHVLSWESSDPLHVQVTSVDTVVRFRGDRTYWLVGLTGNLGLSLCEWMAQQGARYIVVSSRKPKVDAEWLKSMSGIGVTVEVIANDICDRASVQAVHSQIQATLPPIAGVAQGAMVLHDAMFLDLTMDRISKVTSPKINGALFLEEIFHDIDLEFFVFFSSMAAITGNPGQSAYAAANMFMASLASERRRRGLNASAVHIGAIFGNGYVTRELTLAQQEFLGKVGNLWLSEQDFRLLFAEAVLAGQHHRGKSSELSTGLKMIDASQQSDITWFRNPMFQHCIKSADQDMIGLDNNGGKSRALPVKTQLLEAVSPSEVYEIIFEGYAAKLRSSLQIEEDRNLKDLTADLLGIDSLVAVDIRSWFIKEVQVEMPVLKILSGATVDELLARAQELIPPTLTPLLDPANKSGPRPKDKSKGTASSRSEPALKPTQSTQTTKAAVKRNLPTSARPLQAQQSGFSTSADASYVLPKEARAQKIIQKPGDAPGKRDGSEMSSVKIVKQSPAITKRPPRAPTQNVDMKTLETQKHIFPAKGVVLASQTTFKTPSSGSSSNTWSEIDASEYQSQSSALDSSTMFDESLAGIKSSKYSAHNTGTKTLEVWDVTKRVPISFAQARFWFLEHYLEDAPAALNITLAIDLVGSLNIEMFERGVKLIGQRHEALRTRFAPSDDSNGGDHVMQEVLTASPLNLELSSVSSDEEADNIYKDLQTYRYKLTKGESMRILLLKKSASCHRLIIGYHHINMDGVSLEVILREMQIAYDSKRLPSRQGVLQYPDFSEKQHREYKSGGWADDIAFWRAELGGNPSALEPIHLLPMAKKSYRSGLTSYSAITTEFHLDSKLLQSIQSTCSRLKVTPFHFHLAVFYALLSRYADAKEICIGVSSANRGSGADNMMHSVGMYLNLLPLLLKSQPGHTFTTILKMVREKSLSAFAHSKVPFDVIVNELGLHRSTTHAPLFQVLVNYRAGVSERRVFCNCESKIVNFEQGQTAYDISLDIIENPDSNCRIILTGQKALYDVSAMSMLKDTYIRLLALFANNPALRVSNVPLFGIEDIKRALQAGRGPFYQHQWPGTISHRIDAMVKKYGAKTALADAANKKSSISYSQMNHRVNAIATSLGQHHQPVGLGSIVGVFLDPGMDWICSLLAILRLGAVYVPLDSRSGLDRLRAIVDDCKPAIIIICDATEQEFEIFNPTPALNIDKFATTRITTILPNAAKPDSVAAIMYTSGSTGSPKGIIMNHASFAHNIEIMTTKCCVVEGEDVMLQQSSYSFDMSLCQTFLALSNGGALHIVPKQLRADPSAIAAIISSQGVTFTTATPSEYISWIRYGQHKQLQYSRWRLAMAGGEMVSKMLTDSFSELGKRDLSLVDCYGPTEITFCSSSKQIDYWSLQTDAAEMMGLQTWPNYSICIVDANLKPVPVGIPGEVVIGGAGVTAGYLHDDLNARAFMAKESFASPQFLEAGWDKFHRTGDTGRLSRTDGSLLLSGRIAGDTQIKLRGLRIDLREVEAAIFKAGGGRIKDVAVIVRESKQTKLEFLAAFVTVADDSSMDEGELEQIIYRLPLPQYMRPSTIVCLLKLPISASHKVDRIALNSLPLPERHSDGTPAMEAELNSNESRLRQLWEDVISLEVLNQHQISTASDFFHSGGNSMLLVRLRSEIQKVFPVGENISLFQLFDASTLGGMASLVQEAIADRSRVEKGEEIMVVPADAAVTPIDWEDETAVSSSLLRTSAPRNLSAQPEVVILTGASGFLGRAILARMLDDGVVRKIHCLAVRQPIEVKKNFPTLFTNKKVIVHKGDLSQPHMGMVDEAELTAIFAEAHAIIHNGADVSFMKSYASLKPTNVASTKELVRLSLPYQLSFHYVSSAAVTQLSGQESYQQCSVSTFPPPSLPSDLQGGGYLTTKWACEYFLEKVSERCGLPIWIHRPSSITGEGAPDTDLMMNLFRYAREVKAVPNMDLWKGWLDMVSVECVAMTILDQVYEDDLSPNGVKFLFESGEREINLSDLKGVLEREMGEKVETVSLDMWVERAKDKGLHPLLGEYLRGLEGTKLVFPRLLHESEFI